MRAGCEANFQTVGDIGEFYQDSHQTQLNAAPPLYIFSALRLRGLVKRGCRNGCRSEDIYFSLLEGYSRNSTLVNGIS